MATTRVPRPEGGFYDTQELRDLGFYLMVAPGISTTTGRYLDYTGCVHRVGGCAGRDTTPERHGWQPEDLGDELLAAQAKFLCTKPECQRAAATVTPLRRPGRRPGRVREADPEAEERLRRSAWTIDGLRHELATVVMERDMVLQGLSGRGYTQRELAEIYNSEAQVPITEDAVQKALARMEAK